MSKKEKIFVLLAVLLGVFIQFAFTTLLLMGLIALLSFASVCLLFSSILLGRKALKWGLIAITPLAAALGISSGMRFSNHKKASQITFQLQKYKKEHGTYPKELVQASTITLKGLRYETNDDKNNYRIEYLMDGFNREYYKSKTGTWGTLGWND